MKLIAVAILSALSGAAASSWYFSTELSGCRADLESAAQAYAVTTATYASTFVEALWSIRSGETAGAIAVLEPRLKRDLEFLITLDSGPQTSPTISEALATGEAYQSEFQQH